MSEAGQGDIQAPPIFNVVLNLALNLAVKEKSVSSGFTLQKRQSSRQPETSLVEFDYADDLAATDNTQEGLQETTDLNVKQCAKAGLFINASKTKVMNVCKHSTQQPYLREQLFTVKINDIECQQVSQFV